MPDAAVLVEPDPVRAAVVMPAEMKVGHCERTDAHPVAHQKDDVLGLSRSLNRLRVRPDMTVGRRGESPYAEPDGREGAGLKKSSTGRGMGARAVGVLMVHRECGCDCPEQC